MDKEAEAQTRLSANRDLSAQLERQNLRVAQLDELQKALVVRGLARYRLLVERGLPQGTTRRRLYTGLRTMAVRPVALMRDALSLLRRVVSTWQTGGTRLVLQRARRKLQEASRRERGGDLPAAVVTDEPLQRTQSLAFPFRPLISVIVPVYDAPLEHLAAALRSIRAQTYPYFEICICDDGSRNPATTDLLRQFARTDKRMHVVYSARNAGISAATNRAARQASGEYLAFLDHDDVLTSNALFEIARKLNQEPGLDCVYSDQDKIDAAGVLTEPFYKPDWSPIYLESVMYIGHLLAVRRELFERLGGMNSEYDGVQDFEFMLRVGEATAAVGHVARVLYHWRKIPGSVALGLDEKGSRIEELQVKAVNAHLARMGVPAAAFGHPMHRHRVQVRPNPRTGHPLVSIVVTTRDAPDDLDRCLTSIFDRTTYSAFEVVVVDNQTTDARALRVLKQHPVRVVPLNERFNFSRANNLGVQQAKGEYVILLNNDTEVLTPEWIEILIGYLERDGVGIVGPLLVYPDHTVQHAGVVLGPRGTADHVMRHFPAGSDGYAGSLSSAREVSAVTGACMMVRRREYLEFGGLVEYYGTHYQDVDFCLRVLEAGRSIICVPTATLIYREGASRGAFYDHLDRALLLDTWGHLVARGDRYFNPHFSRETADYGLAVGVRS